MHWASEKFVSAQLNCHKMENVAVAEGEDAVGGGWMGRKPITAFRYDPTSSTTFTQLLHSHPVSFFWFHYVIVLSFSFISFPTFSSFSEEF